MRKLILNLLFGLLGFISSAQSLKVVIKQDGKIIEPVNDVYDLRKTTFVFEITSFGGEGFLLGVTADKNIYENAYGLFNPEVPWFQNTGMAEELYNKEKEMFLMDTAPSYWYYTDAKDHRFDKTPKGNSKQWTGTRTISRVYDIMNDRAISLKDLSGNLYVLMYEAEYNDEYDVTGKKNLFNAVLKFKD
ncbi:hypothetical protein VUJ46_07255 [Chryseobacterium sp. MYb264]|uniref:hypothetical protein n=1 Tax=Chryseobacterium sp. MYb264 TaxID=2745153 RepID=UPI002E0DB637|nr:hypothetical protein VUJ46_07255 [Chryseobacterium sp. MYb264]